MTLDRINSDKGYTPDNCRWATKTTQARNTRANHIVDFRGERMTQIEFAEMVGMKQKNRELETAERLDARASGKHAAVCR